MSDPLPIVELSQFVVLRDEEPVFSPVSFTLLPGETGCLTGPNGSGKSTLLRALAGLPHEASGRAVVEKDALFIGHRTGMSGRLTCRENLSLYEHLDQGAASPDVNDALESVGLHGWEDEEARFLSAGQKRRLALARLPLSRAALWLLDEPNANLDPQGRELVSRLMQDHCAAGGAVFLSSHQSQPADRYCELG